MSVAREIERYMKEAGFWLKRRGKHNVWTNGMSTVVTAISPSDHRALLNIKKEVNRQRAGG